ncbi:MAG: hypothetical protein H0V01_01260 [Bacteroidetes bacterium]|nr:hypothetical protein [Bacteroidota bacterium]HET6243168.1 hypothetical protein [Bacteroidia bacterium]
MVDENLQSPRYARSLQEDIVPYPNSLVNIFPDSFIYNKPKQIVSGDFF